MNPSKDRIVIISPVRNEEEFLPLTIASVISQSILPIEWIIVDDGSSDRTAEIVKETSVKYPWIRLISKPDRGERSVGPGVVETFYFGYNQIKSKNYNYICKMDGDIEFTNKYFETLLSYFNKDKYLGAASGKPYLITESGKKIPERKNNEMVAGMINFYRKECFDAIGGFVKEVHWDGIVIHRARMAGWRTRSIVHPDLAFIHERLMGSSHKGVLHGRLRWGRGQFFMGTHPLYILAIGVYRMFEKPFIIGGLWIILGYIIAFFKGMKRYEFTGFRKSLHAWQMERLHLGKRKEIIPDPGNLYEDKF